LLALRPSNALPFSGLGAAKPASRFYADASAATTSAATACWTAYGFATFAQRPSEPLENTVLNFHPFENPNEVGGGELAAMIAA
jgi:cytochrome c2